MASVGGGLGEYYYSWPISTAVEYEFNRLLSFFSSYAPKLRVLQKRSKRGVTSVSESFFFIMK